LESLRLTEEEAQALKQGIREFNGGYYFEAHDTLEEVWRGIRGPHRAFYHGLIQMATGLYHLTGENLKGAESQLSAGLQKLLPFGAFYLGVDVSGIVRQAEDILGAVRSAGTQGGTRPENTFSPRIVFDPERLAKEAAEGAEK
jgi:predicted metal-dependent hydrolase